MTGDETIDGVRHLYECPMRWADLDPLNHVNNVVYGDYLQDARVDMFRTYAPHMRVQELTERPAEALVVVSHDITYLAPMELHTSVMVECWISEIRAAAFTVAYEVFSDRGGERLVHARATTVLSPFAFAEGRPRRLTAQEKEILAPLLEPAPTEKVERTPAHVTPEGTYDLHVRFSDVDVYGHVNNVMYLGYFQEARIAFMAKIKRGVEGASKVNVVVARTQVEYLRPVLHRAEPYPVHSWISRMGNKSFVVESELRGDDDVVLSRSRVVMVFFDRHTQRSTQAPADVHAAVSRYLAP